MQHTVLVVDDENDLVENLAFNLEKAGYMVRRAGSGGGALAQATTTPLPDLILLDLQLPDLSGTEVCRRLRANAQTAGIPIIMITAKGEEVDRVVGLEVGADDYVVKPFSVRELMLRIRAVLRRSAAETAPTSSATQFGELQVDPEAHRVWVGEDEVVLTALEFKLLETLLAARGRVQTRERLLMVVWNMPSDLSTRTVDTHVKRLRQKLGSAGRYIETVRGIGYRFTDEAGGGDA